MHIRMILSVTVFIFQAAMLELSHHYDEAQPFPP